MMVAVSREGVAPTVRSTRFVAAFPRPRPNTDQAA
jgi:hypothetical protein